MGTGTVLLEVLLWNEKFLYKIDFHQDGLGMLLCSKGGAISQRFNEPVDKTVANKKLCLLGRFKRQRSSAGTRKIYNVFCSECQWRFSMETENTQFVLHCDYFDVGRAQESGRCWGDVLLIFAGTEADSSSSSSPNTTRNLDHSGFCGAKHGIEIRAAPGSKAEGAVAPFVKVKFSTKGDSQSKGFSCIVSAAPSFGANLETEDEDQDGNGDGEVVVGNGSSSSSENLHGSGNFLARVDGRTDATNWDSSNLKS